MLYAIVDRRHEKRSTVVTTNLSFEQWGSVFPGAACVVALVDRFAQHCHVVDIDADSWRQKNALGREPRDGAPNGAPSLAVVVEPNRQLNSNQTPSSFDATLRPELNGNRDPASFHASTTPRAGFRRIPLPLPPAT